MHAKYNAAYSTLKKEMWWDVESCGGPIIEQATHFCDLARFFGGEVELDTLHATSIKQTDTLGQLSDLPPNVRNLEQSLPPHRRIPRVTSAMWRYSSGAIGTLTHAVLLHGEKYETAIEIWGDGYLIEFIDPYGKSKVKLRLPESENPQLFEFDGDDMYLTEDRAFLEAVINKDSSSIQSSYKDACNTYALSWKIRTAAEK